MILVLAERSKVSTLQGRKAPKALKIRALRRVQPILARLAKAAFHAALATKKSAFFSPSPRPNLQMSEFKDVYTEIKEKIRDFCLRKGAFFDGKKQKNP